MGKLFDELAALKEAYDRKLEEEGEAALKEAFKEIFDKHPRLDSIMWVQYTPYFNDGDPCYFSVHDFDVSITEPEEAEESGEVQTLEETEENEEDEDEDEEDDDELYGDDYSYGERLYALQRSKDAQLKQIAEDVSELNGNIPDEVLEHVFGDHARIKATREGFSVDEYDHD